MSYLFAGAGIMLVGIMSESTTKKNENAARDSLRGNPGDN